MKKVIIFGATGTIGQHLVSQAIHAGHSVTAFVRNPSKLTITSNRLNFVTGDVLKILDVESAIEGHDTVIIALGAGRKGNTRQRGTENIINAMKKSGSTRLICQSTLGTGDSNHTLNFFWKNIMFGWFLKKAFLDHEYQEKLVKDSGLDWTIVRPGAFTNGPLTNSYVHGDVPQNRKLKLKISRADVASFLLKQVTDNSYMHQSPILSY